METTLYIVWQHENETGSAILDDQHRGIIATINSLHYFIQLGYGLEALQPTLKIMEEYIGFHLKTEEMVLEERKYPDLDESVSYHQKTLKQLKKVSTEAMQYRDPNMLLRFLREWWLVHLHEQHGRYCEYLQ